MNNNEISIYEVVEGDFNDVYSRKTIRATESQMEKYVKDQFSDEGKKRMVDLGSDSIGYGIFYENEIDPETGEEYEDQELRLEYYVEAVYIDRDGDNETYHIDIDLTEDNNDQVSST
jgi:hypothetical protein